MLFQIPWSHFVITQLSEPSLSHIKSPAVNTESLLHLLKIMLKSETIILLIAIVDIDVEIKLSSKKFKKDLEDKSSPAYKNLKQEVRLEV